MHMNICKEYRIYLEKDITQFISLPGKIELITQILGPSAVIVHDNTCHHLYLDYVSLRDKLEKTRTVLYNDFRNFTEFETYLSDRGIYIAYFNLNELSNITEFGSHRIRERLPYAFNKVRVLRGSLYNVITLEDCEVSSCVGALFIRNVDVDEILNYYTYVVYKIVDVYGRIDIGELLESNMYGIHRLKDGLKEIIESGLVKNREDMVIAKNMYDIIDSINGIIKLAML